MKKHIAVMAGGDSGEYEISIQSASKIAENLDSNLFTSRIIHLVGKEWTFQDSDGKIYHIDKNDFSLTIDGKKEFFDVAFIAIHGTPGENGILQGYFQLMRIPYVGSDVLTSSFTFNKNYGNRIVKTYGIPVADSVHLFQNDRIDIDEIISVTQLPCFVKPCNSGSSVGMSKVNKKEELMPAIALAFEHDDQILIETFIEGREITCGVFRSGKEIISLPITEIITQNEYFDYEAKYDPSLTDEITPAQIDDAVAEKCRNWSVFLYERLACSGVSRFDYIFNDENLYFLEVNTIPGQSQNSIVPQQVRAFGLNVTDFYSMLINEALHNEI